MALLEFESALGVMTYDRRGLGDPLLLLHGVYPGASHHEFARNIAALQKQFQVYSIDLLGFGQSDTPKIPYSTQTLHHLTRDFIRDVVGAPVSVIASGFNTGIAARLGVFDDGLLQKLVLLAPIVKSHYHEPPGLADAFSRFLLGTLAVGKSLYDVHASRAGLFHFLKEHYHAPAKISHEMVEQLFVEANEPNKMLPYISALCGYFDTDLSNWLPGVRRPTLLLMGQDAPLPPETWLRKGQWSMGRQIAIIDQAKDFPHQEQSAAVNRVLMDFLTLEHVPRRDAIA